MENIYECCNFNDNQCECKESTCSNSVCNDIDCINNELCDMKADIAAARANLINLVRVMCICGGIFAEEKQLLISIEKSLNSLDCSIAKSRKCAQSLDNEIC
ncbi:hypothetical protein ACQPU1_11335 [Clostridium paraputrificum]|uniref:hypothetical protein n=1 Tax=Clostridium TaxID=1485 RepID=UPI003D33B023